MLFRSPLAGRTHSFTATYSQAEGDTISWVRWRIAVDGQEDSPLLDTGDIYGTSQLQADYDAFFAGTTYAVRCDVGTNAGQEASTGWQTVTVSYSAIAPNGLLNVECRRDGAVAINWSTARNTVGAGSGSYEIKGGNLVMNDGSSVTWTEENGEPIEYIAPWTLLWRGIPRKRNGGNLFEATTESGNVIAAAIAKTGTSGAIVTVKLNGTTIGTITIASGVYLDRTWTLIITPDRIYAGYAEGTGGLYPAANLYPGAALYPRDNTSYTMTTWNASMTYTQGAISQVQLIGAQTVEWLWIVTEEMDGSEITSILNNASYEPEWSDGETAFLAGFTDSLNAGNLNTTGYTLYRRNLTAGAYEKIGEFDINELSVLDYSACNNNAYVYQLWYTDATTFISTPIESVEITPCTWNHTILGCTQKEDGTYHVVKIYPFSANVTTGSMSNNNEPKIQKNFTRYPSWQPDPALYKSGKLKALIGHVNNLSQYVGDTTMYADELRSLSQTGMVLFLKDRRGDLIRIRTNGAITAEVKDEWQTQSLMIEIPWLEVGSAEGVSIVMTSADALWGTDGIRETSVWVDVETGQLLWSVPNGYDTERNGSGLVLTDAGYLVQESGPWYTPDTLYIDSAQNLMDES